MSLAVSPSKQSDSKDENNSFEQTSTPKRRLLEAIKQDTSIDKEVRVMETQKVAKSISEKMWTTSLLSAIENIATGTGSPGKSKEAKSGSSSPSSNFTKK